VLLVKKLKDISYENPQFEGNEEWIESEENNNFKTTLYIATAIVVIAGLYVAKPYLSSDKNWGYKMAVIYYYYQFGSWWRPSDWWCR
jgi:hypothetical protein